MAETRVRELTYSNFEEDEGGEIRINKRGELIVTDWKEQAALDGRCFNFANLTPDTLITGTVDYAAATPEIIIVVPVGTTILPYYVCITHEDQAGTLNNIKVGFDTGNLYTSGGTVGSAINNLRTDDPFKSAITTAKNGHVAIVMVDPTASERFMFHWVDPFVHADDRGGHYIIEWKPRVSPVLVGPATFYVYDYSATTGAAYEYVVQWVEVPTASI